MGVELAREDLLSAPEKVAECPGLFVSKLTPTGFATTGDFELAHRHVGASLLAKTYFQPPRKWLNVPASS